MTTEIQAVAVSSESDRENITRKFTNVENTAMLICDAFCDKEILLRAPN
jgi:hypothetical protein